MLFLLFLLLFQFEHYRTVLFFSCSCCSSVRKSSGSVYYVLVGINLYFSDSSRSIVLLACFSVVDLWKCISQRAPRDRTLKSCLFAGVKGGKNYSCIFVRDSIFFTSPSFLPVVVDSLSLCTYYEESSNRRDNKTRIICPCLSLSHTHTHTQTHKDCNMPGI